MKMYEIHMLNKKGKEKSSSRLAIAIEVAILKDIKIPLAKIVKDAKDTIKPYKNFWQISRDLYAQPFYGIGNTIRGVLGIAFTPFIFFGFLAAPFLGKQYAINLSKIAALIPASSLLYIFRGLTQIATWPLTLLRMPVRGIITFVKGSPKIEDSKGLRDLVIKYDAAVTAKNETTPDILNVLLKKFDKGLQRKQKTLASKEEFKNLQKEVKKFSDYPDSMSKPVITFFKAVIEKRDTEIALQKARKLGK